MIYFFRSHRPDRIKIGTTRKLTMRLKALVREHGEGDILGVMPGGVAEEEALHQEFASDRIAGEWFEPSVRLEVFVACHAASWDGTDETPKASESRLELPAAEMDRLRRAARSIGLSLSAFIRQAVLEKTVDVEQRMRL